MDCSNDAMHTTLERSLLKMPKLNADQLAALAKKRAEADVKKIKMSKKELEKITGLLQYCHAYNI